MLRLPLNIVVYQPSDAIDVEHWIAHCLEFNVIGEGDRPQSALNRLAAVAGNNINRERDKVDVFRNLIQPASWYYYLAFAEGQSIDCPRDWDKYILKITDEFPELKKGWCENADPPSSESCVNALTVLSVYRNEDFYPTRVVPTVMGGVAISVRLGNRKLFVECYNTGKICYLMAADNSDEMTTGEVIRSGISDLVERAKLFLEYRLDFPIEIAHDIKIETNIRVSGPAGPNNDKLLGDLAIIINRHGPYSDEVKDFLEKNKTNKEFIELANLAQKLKKALDKNRD